MSNPLLKPEDPRFRKPELRDEAGQNRFAEEEAAKAGEDSKSGDAFATASGDARPFDPRYEAHQTPRTALLYLLDGMAWTGAAVGVIALSGVIPAGWIFPLLGIAPAGAAWLLAWDDIKAIRTGAMAAEARPATRLAMWIGLLGLFACASIVGSMIYREMPFLPDVL
jgi:hypothetical protein